MTMTNGATAHRSEVSDAALEAWADMDTQRQYRILKNASLVGTDLEDKLLGTLAGMYPERYHALKSMLERTDEGWAA